MSSVVIGSFAATLFLSAALLFTIQPMFAKMVLPLLGGTPAVWNTCMVFYQATLLAGYAYAHATASLGLRRQTLVHLGCLLAPLLFLPIAIPAGWNPPAQQNPMMWLFALLCVALGPPFFVISATAPLVQSWFKRSRHRLAHDPYFLYTASNAGSLVALLAYPTVIEPNLRLVDQSRVWTGGYLLLIALLVTCMGLVWRSGLAAAGAAAEGPREASGSDSPPTSGQRVRWVMLALLPSSLMVGLTTYLTTDVAPVPLFWILPLALYLLSFVLAFGRRVRLPHRVMVRLMPIVVLPVSVSMALGAAGSAWILVPFHLLAFFVAAMVCHGELARSRPQADRLTEFYLWVAIGGVLGSSFNVLLAPLIFNRVVEYPLALVAACLLRPPDRGGPAMLRPGRWEVLGPVAVGSLFAAAIWLTRAEPIGGWAAALLTAAVPALGCFALRARPLAFGLGIAALIVTPALVAGEADGRTLYRDRSFFGVWSVRTYAAEHSHVLLSGVTEHGRQSLEADREREPLTYYERTGPIGEVFSALPGPRNAARVAVIGLGTGALACHGRAGQQFTFYEIDPTVVRIASDPRYFGFLRNCPPEVRVVVGDARRSLAEAPDHSYGLIVLDAFSSDAIPVHLLTREALRLYLDKLDESGLLAFHISNRLLDLEPTIGNLADDARLFAVARLEVAISAAAWRSGKRASHWVVLARRRSDLGPLSADPKWRVLPPHPEKALWTDDFSNLIAAIKWE
jgi:hypothetical protein